MMKIELNAMKINLLLVGHWCPPIMRQAFKAFILIFLEFLPQGHIFFFKSFNLAFILTFLEAKPCFQILFNFLLHTAGQ